MFPAASTLVSRGADPEQHGLVTGLFYALLVSGVVVGAPLMAAVALTLAVKPGRAEENADLVRAVYGELADLRPPGFRYATFVLENAVTFVHLAVTDGDSKAPLPQLAAFRRFGERIAERCDEPPQTTRLSTRIGSYGL